MAIELFLENIWRPPDPVPGAQTVTFDQLLSGKCRPEVRVL
jgi:hypothetical protein